MLIYWLSRRKLIYLTYRNKQFLVGPYHTQDFTWRDPSSLPDFTRRDPPSLPAAFNFAQMCDLRSASKLWSRQTQHSQISKDCLIECLPRQFLVYLLKKSISRTFKQSGVFMKSNFKTGHKKLPPVFSQRTGRKVGTGCCTSAGCNNVAKNGKFWVNNPIIVFFVPSWIMFIRNSRKGHSVPMHLRFGASLCIGTIITMSPNFVVFDIRLFRRGRNGMSECSFRVSRI